MPEVGDLFGRVQRTLPNSTFLRWVLVAQVWILAQTDLSEMREPVPMRVRVLALALLRALLERAMLQPMKSKLLWALRELQRALQLRAVLRLQAQGLKAGAVQRVKRSHGPL